MINSEIIYEDLAEIFEMALTEGNTENRQYTFDSETSEILVEEYDEDGVVIDSARIGIVP